MIIPMQVKRADALRAFILYKFGGKLKSMLDALWRCAVAVVIAKG